MAHEQLAIYLMDHFAGSQAALEIVSDIESANTDTAIAETMRQLRPEIEHDREVLRQLLEKLDSTPSNTRKAVGWLSEKILELKLRVDDSGSGGLRLLESTEVLTLGITGKIALWRALQSNSDVLPALGTIDYARLLADAARQLEGVEKIRITAARAAFAGDSI